MQNEAEDYKSLFFHHLKPFLDMLEYQLPGMDSQEWGATVYRIASSVERNPEQYLGRDLPKRELTAQIIREIFEVFIQDHALVVEE
jgi:hypothetical protein